MPTLLRRRLSSPGGITRRMARSTSATMSSVCSTRVPAGGRRGRWEGAGAGGGVGGGGAGLGRGEEVFAEERDRDQGERDEAAGAPDRHPPMPERPGQQ